MQSLPIGGSICAGGITRPPPFKFWISIICYETLLCGLAIYKGYQTFRKKDPIAGWSGTKLLDILIRDSILYFLVWDDFLFPSMHMLRILRIFAVYATNLIVWLVRPVCSNFWSLCQLDSKIQNLAELPVNYAIALPTIMTERLLFNIKQSASPRYEKFVVLENRTN